MKKLSKNTVIFILILSFFLLFNSGFRSDKLESLFQSLVFTLVLLSLIFQPWLKKAFVILSLILYVFMIILFTLDYIPIANVFGSLGFGILIISGIFCLPKLLKYGYI